MVLNPQKSLFLAVLWVNMFDLQEYCNLDCTCILWHIPDLGAVLLRHYEGVKALLVNFLHWT